MKYTVEHVCGDVQIHQIYGPERDRPGKAAWLAGRPCTDCWRVERQQERQRKRDATIAAAADLPPLAGTPRDIGRAVQLRQQALDGMDECIAEFARWREVSAAQRAEWRELLLSVTDAAEWIECTGDWRTVVRSRRQPV